MVDELPVNVFVRWRKYITRPQHDALVSTHLLTTNLYDVGASRCVLDLEPVLAVRDIPHSIPGAYGHSLGH